MGDEVTTNDEVGEGLVSEVPKSSPRDQDVIRLKK